MANLNQIKFRLKEEKISLMNGKTTHKMKKVLEAKEEIQAMRNRMKIMEGIQNKNQNKVKKTELKKEKMFKELEKMKEEAIKNLKEITQENERLSKESKELK